MPTHITPVFERNTALKVFVKDKEALNNVLLIAKNMPERAAYFSTHKLERVCILLSSCTWEASRNTPAGIETRYNVAIEGATLAKMTIIGAVDIQTIPANNMK